MARKEAPQSRRSWPRAHPKTPALGILQTSLISPKAGWPAWVLAGPCRETRLCCQAPAPDNLSCPAKFSGSVGCGGSSCLPWRPARAFKGVSTGSNGSPSPLSSQVAGATPLPTHWPGLPWCPRESPNATASQMPLEQGLRLAKHRLSRGGWGVGIGGVAASGTPKVDFSPLPRTCTASLASFIHPYPHPHCEPGPAGPSPPEYPRHPTTTPAPFGPFPPSPQPLPAPRMWGFFPSPQTLSIPSEGGVLPIY